MGGVLAPFCLSAPRAVMPQTWLAFDLSALFALNICHAGHVTSPPLAKPNQNHLGPFPTVRTRTRTRTRTRSQSQSHSCSQELRAEREWSEPEPEPEPRTPFFQTPKVSVTRGTREEETFLHWEKC